MIFLPLETNRFANLFIKKKFTFKNLNRFSFNPVNSNVYAFSMICI